MSFSQTLQALTAGNSPAVTTGIWTGVLLFIIYLLREWRETRKLSLEDRLARREGYAAQVESLMTENRLLRQEFSNAEKAHRKEISEMRAEHDEFRRLCHAETDQLRDDIRDLENEIAGLRRQIRQQSTSIAREVGKGKLPTSMLDRGEDDVPRS